jgi:hypothetical protein
MSLFYVDANLDHFHICLDKDYNFIKESNEWFYLINFQNGQEQKYQAIKNHIMGHLEDIVVVPKNVLLFISTIRSGLHAYCAIYYLFCEYLYNYTKYEKYTIVVYNNLQQSVKELIHFFVKDIIYIEANTIYQFDEVCIIPNKLHSYFENIEARDQVVSMIHEKILKSPLLTLKKYKIDDTYKNKNICILKTHGEGSPLGCLQKETIEYFVEKTGYMYLQPCNYNEIQLIQILQQCGEILVLSWGTAFQKNFVYIGDQVLKVIVLMTDGDCIHQYHDLKNRNVLVNTFKNATFYYIQVEESNLYNESFYDNFQITVTIPKMVYYCIDKNNYFNICLDSQFNIIKNSNDWLYLLNTSHEHISHSENIRQHIITNINSVYNIHENVIPFITGFNGGVHVFCGIYSILLEYLQNYKKYEKYKIIVYKHVHKGVKDIINFFVKEKDIIYIDGGIIYKFDEIYIIPNKLHSYFEDIEIRDQIAQMIQDYILNSSLLSYTIDNKYKYKNICSFKHQSSGINSTYGSISRETIEFFVTKTGYIYLEPADYNEIQLIQIFHECGPHLVLSWGTLFQKNFVYIGDQVLKVTVFIIGPEFTREYYHMIEHDKIVYKFNNATFHYFIVNESDFWNDSFYITESWL